MRLTRSDGGVFTATLVHRKRVFVLDPYGREALVLDATNFLMVFSSTANFISLRYLVITWISRAQSWHVHNPWSSIEIDVPIASVAGVLPAILLTIEPISNDDMRVTVLK